MLFELPHYALELLVVLPLVQVGAMRSFALKCLLGKSSSPGRPVLLLVLRHIQYHKFPALEPNDWVHGGWRADFL